MIATATLPVTLVILHMPGPGWIADLSAIEQPAVPEHLAYLARLAELGRIVMSGPFLDGTGGMAILGSQVDAAEAHDIVAGDPAVVAGVITAEIRPWMVTIDRISAAASHDELF